LRPLSRFENRLFRLPPFGDNAAMKTQVRSKPPIAMESDVLSTTIWVVDQRAFMLVYWGIWLLSGVRPPGANRGGICKGGWVGGVGSFVNVPSLRVGDRPERNNCGPHRSALGKGPAAPPVPFP
jgi:hypothetical protein